MLFYPILFFFFFNLLYPTGFFHVLKTVSCKSQQGFVQVDS